MNELSIFTNKKVDISKPAQLATLVAQAKAAENILKDFWGVVEQQMLDRNISSVKGDWGSISFQEAELLAITNADVLDPSVTKPALDTKKVRAYRELMGELPAGVGSKNITKFVKRIKG